MHWPYRITLGRKSPSLEAPRALALPPADGAFDSRDELLALAPIEDALREVVGGVLEDHVAFGDLLQPEFDGCASPRARVVGKALLGIGDAHELEAAPAAFSDGQV